MKKNPLFSIITPVYNCENYIEQCILSIRNQQYTNFEHIIVDGGSTDGTLDIIKKYAGTYPMRYVSEKDNGMYDAINKGFAMAKGDIFCWLNADDCYMPHALQLVAEAFVQKNVAWVTGIPAVFVEGETDGGTQYVMTDMPFLYARSYLKKGYYEGRLLGFIQQESTFWSSELWEKAGPIPDTYKYAGDHYLWKQFAKYEPLYTINSIVANFRVHKEQKTAQMDRYYAEIGKKTWKYKVLRRPLKASLSLYQILFYKKRMIDARELIGIK